MGQRSFAALTLFGLGYLRYSASLASLLAVLAYLALSITPFGTYPAAAFFVAVVAAAAFMCPRHAAWLSTDPPQAVIDEFIGMFLCLLCAGTTNAVAIGILFVGFRVLDIVKPFPFDLVDRYVRGAYGFIVDDALIGAVLGVCCRIVLMHLG